MKKTSAKALILAAYPRAGHLDLFTIMEERRELRTQTWQRMPEPMTSTRKVLSGQIGADTGKFQTVILCVDSSRCFLQMLTLPTTDAREIESMTATARSLFPVLTQPDYVSSHAVLGRDSTHSLVLATTFKKAELVAMLEKIEQWGADLPVVVPDSWVLWTHLAQSHQLPEHYVWIWLDPAQDEKNVSLKIFFVSHGQLRYVFQPFVPLVAEEHLANHVADAIQMAADCAARDQVVLPADATYFFSSYRFNLANLLPKLSVGHRPVRPLPLQHPPQETAATLRQTNPAGFKDWLPSFWKSYQAERARSRSRSRLLKIGAALYAVFLIGLLAIGLWQRAGIHGEEAAHQARKTEYDRAVALKKQVSRMTAQAQGDQGALDVLYLATTSMPRELTLTGYSFKYQDGLSLRGFAVSNAAVYDFVEALKKQKPFVAVELNSVRNNAQKNWVEFDIQCRLGIPPATVEKI
jgi:hypothetical protein